MDVKAAAIRATFEDVSLGSPENAVGFILWRITSRYQREMDRALAGVDLTNLQFVCLALVAWFGRSGEAVSQAEVARFGGIHPMQLSLMLKALEGKKFILRRRSETDSRVKEAVITKSGLAALRKALPLAIGVQKELFGEEGRPGGSLHEMLLGIDARLAEEE